MSAYCYGEVCRTELLSWCRHHYIKRIVNAEDDTSLRDGVTLYTETHPDMRKEWYNIQHHEEGD